MPCVSNSVILRLTSKWSRTEKTGRRTAGIADRRDGLIHSRYRYGGQRYGNIPIHRTEPDAACRIIRNYKDYEFLSVQELSAENYAKYLLKLHQIYIEKELEPYVRLQEYGLQKMKENGPVETIFGTLIWKGHPIQELSPFVLEFRLYNSLAVTVYWNESDSFALELLYG